MGLVIADRVKEGSSTTGTGTLDLDGATSGFQGFVAAIGTGNTCYYAIEDGSNWEVGIGTVTDATPDTLARTTILKSSNAGAAISCSGGQSVFVTSPAAVFQPKQTMWIPGTSFTPIYSAAAPEYVYDELDPAGAYFYAVGMLFAGANADHYAQVAVALPNGWDKGPIQYQVYWTVAAGTATNGVSFFLNGRAYSDDDPMGTTAGGTEVGVTDSVIAADDLHISAVSADVTIAGTPVNDSMCMFRLSRVGTDVGDTETNAVNVLGIKLFYSLETLTDS